MSCISYPLDIPGSSLSEYVMSFRLPIVPRAHHINFGHSHPPRKITPKCRFGIPRMNFPEFPGSAFFLAFQNSSTGSPEFPEFSGISLERVFGVPESRFRGKMKLICWAAVSQLRELKVCALFWAPIQQAADTSQKMSFCGPYNQHCGRDLSCGGLGAKKFIPPRNAWSFLHTSSKSMRTKKL